MTEIDAPAADAGTAKGGEREMLKEVNLFAVTRPDKAKPSAASTSAAWVPVSNELGLPGSE